MCEETQHAQAILHTSTEMTAYTDTGTGSTFITYYTKVNSERSKVPTRNVYETSLLTTRCVPNLPFTPHTS